MSDETRCAFDLDHYAEILRAAQEADYRIITAREFAAQPDGPRPLLVLRHDVDTSLEYAVRMAETEQELGARSTYFVRLHSRMYDPRSDEDRERLHRLAELGHEIGLHFELSHLGEDGWADALAREREELEAVAGSPVVGAAEHMPDYHGRNGRPRLDPAALTKAGLEYEAYSPPFTDLTYLSDSNRNWRRGCMHGWVGSDPALYGLFHPVWWMEDGPDTAELIERLRRGD